MNLNIDFNAVPENDYPEAVPGKYKVTITEANPDVKSTNGRVMLQFAYLVDETNQKINYDNCILTNEAGQVDTTDKGVAFGLRKLKKIMTAAGVDTTISNPVVIAQMLLGKQVELTCKVNDKGYLEVDGDKITPINLVVAAKEAAGEPVSPADFSQETVTTSDL